MFKITNMVPRQTPLLSSIFGLLHSLQLDKYSQVIEGRLGYPPPHNPPPPPVPLRQSACFLSVRLEESVKRFWRFFRAVRMGSRGSADTQEAIRRENPSRSVQGNSITQECWALASTVTCTLVAYSRTSPLCSIFSKRAHHQNMISCLVKMCPYLLRNALPNAFSFLKGFLGSTTKALPGMTPSVSPCITAMKESVVGSGPIRIPGKSCSNR